MKKRCVREGCESLAKSERARYCPACLKKAYQNGQRITTLHLIIKIGGVHAKKDKKHL